MAVRGRSRRQQPRLGHGRPAIPWRSHPLRRVILQAVFALVGRSSRSPGRQRSDALQHTPALVSLRPPAAVQGSANTKTRADVRGGGKKPFKQKGSGSARQGSRRSPLLVGGGVVFGPKPKDWSIKMNKKEKRLAMGTALQSAASDIIGIDSFAALEDNRKTKALVALLKVRHSMLRLVAVGHAWHRRHRCVRRQPQGKALVALLKAFSRSIHYTEGI